MSIKLVDGREVNDLREADSLGVLPLGCTCFYSYGFRHEQISCPVHNPYRELQKDSRA